jgi:CMP-N-acetylneuraminic acid synthetase
MNVVALLPMKAHSARVPGKNFRPLVGKPLYRWMLDKLLSLAVIDRVVINTDARAELSATGFSESGRILLRDRKVELCGDEVSMNLIIKDDIEDVPSDIYIMTHTTNPVLSAKTVEHAIKMFVEAEGRGTADSLFTVNRFQARFYKGDGTPINHDPSNLIRTQDLEPWYEENSNLYVFTRESFSKRQARIGKHPILLETPKVESVDIDEEEDWALAEAIIAANKDRNSD